MVYLLPGAPVVAHVPLQLRAVGEGVAAVRAAVVVLAGLVAILDVLLQRGVALVAPGAVGAGVQLGEGVRRACGGGDGDAEPLATAWMVFFGGGGGGVVGKTLPFSSAPPISAGLCSSSGASG